MNGHNRNIAVLVNPVALRDKARRVGEEISEILTSKNLRYQVFNRNWPGSLDEFSEAWIVGGDGTMNWFVNNYREVKIPLAIFAGGTGNDFHWMLYGKMDFEQQVELVLAASAKKVDAGICNGRLFMNGVGVGFDGAIVKDLVGKKKKPGKTTYLMSVLKHILGYREELCVIEANGVSFRQDCFMISVANARRYGGGFMVAPRSSLTDGLLDLSVIGKISPLKRMRYLPVMEKGEHLQLPFIRYSQSQHVKLTWAKPVHAHLDGEYILGSEFEIAVLPHRFSFLY